MAYGDVVFFTISYTSASASASVNSTKQFYPIKRKYKQTELTQYPSFPGSYEIYDAQEYWFPFDDLSPSEEDYIPYDSGDEFGWNGQQRIHTPDSPLANSDFKKFDLIEPGIRIIYANILYESTNYYFNWTDTSFSVTSNPYNTNVINKWRRFDDTEINWTQYWYHPAKKQFYPLEDSSTLLFLPEDKNIMQSKWSLFGGDTNDINVTSFTSAQVSELVSIGSTTLSATSTVSSIDNNVLELSTSMQTPLERSTDNLVNAISHANPISAIPRPIIASVASRNSTQALGVQSSTSVPNPPSMIQEYKNPDNGLQERDTFVFDYAPNNISYTNIGSQWTEIERINNAPIVDFKNFKHMKISFEFVVSDKSGGISSLYSSCEEQLFKLRKMAARAEFVRFVNFDTLFNRFLIYPKLLLDGNNTAFAIVDMSITSVQRTRSDSAASYSGEISRATVNMTVQEVSTSGPQLIVMPRIVAAPLNPRGRGNTSGDPDACPELATGTPGTQLPARTNPRCNQQ